MSNEIHETDETYSLEDYIAMLPDCVRGMLLNTDVITDPAALALESSRFSFAQADSLYVYVPGGRGRIYVTSPENILHECGHLFDRMFDPFGGYSLSGSRMFEVCFEREAGLSGMPGRLAGSPLEYFAESFSDWCLEPVIGEPARPDAGLMRTARPLTWSFINQAVTRKGGRT